MDILIVGSGGREHALAWKAAQSPLADTVYVAPGNAGTASEPKTVNLEIAADDIDALCRFAKQRAISLTIVGPEAPLAAGIVNQFAEHQLAIFGPTQAAARLESSKDFCKALLQRYGIPTASYQSFEDKQAAYEYLEKSAMPIVIKADGLAAGKGVVIAHSLEVAQQAVATMLSGDRFGSAGQRVVIEDFLVGEEISFICLADGASLLPLASSQDHKARDDGDCGPNTGGMGAYTPAPLVDQALHQRIMDQVMQPMLAAMQAEGTPFSGFLYAGLMVMPNQQLSVLEFNCRLGDPETQPILMRLETDLVELCLAGVGQALHRATVDWRPQSALGVVMANQGYPETYQKGSIIHGLDNANSLDTKVFHAGTSLDRDCITATGGRVLCVTALGQDIQQAQLRAYQACRQIDWTGAFYRKDIGYRAVARLKQ